MKLNKFLIAGLFGLLIGAEGRAATVTISQTNSYSTLATGTRNLTFNLLDSAYGSAVDINDIVSISITGFIDKSAGSWRVENLEGNLVNVDIDQSTKGWFTSTKSIDFAGTQTSPNLISLYYNPVQVSAFSVVTGNFGTDSTGVLGGGISSSLFSEYLGAGTFDIIVNGLQSVSVIGPGIDQSTSSPRLSGNVVVTYEIVPEPSSASLIILGLGGLVALRRMRRKAA